MPNTDRTQSVSSVKLFQTCPQKYDFHYSNLSRRYPATDAMKLGTLVHGALEHSLKNDCSVEMALAYFDFAIEDISIINKARAIVAYYAPLIGFGAGVKPYNRDMIEHRFEAEIDGCKFMGYIDAIIITPNGKITLVDWKTRRTLLDSNQLAMDNQLAVYAYVAKNILGIPIDAVCQVQMKTTLPAKPKLLKNGKVSATLGKTTKAAFIHELNNLGYAGELDEIAALTEQFSAKFVPASDFLRMSYIDMDKIDRQTMEFIAWIKKIKTDQDFLPVNNSRVCEWCQYTDLCLDKVSTI